jgi:hypothetical protein
MLGGINPLIPPTLFNPPVTHSSSSYFCFLLLLPPRVPLPLLIPLDYIFLTIPMHYFSYFYFILILSPPYLSFFYFCFLSYFCFLLILSPPNSSMSHSSYILYLPSPFPHIQFPFLFFPFLFFPYFLTSLSYYFPITSTS